MAHDRALLGIDRLLVVRDDPLRCLGQNTQERVDGTEPADAPLFEVALHVVKEIAVCPLSREIEASAAMASTAPTSASMAPNGVSNALRQRANGSRMGACEVPSRTNVSTSRESPARSRPYAWP